MMVVKTVLCYQGCEWTVDITVPPSLAAFVVAQRRR